MPEPPSSSQSLPVPKVILPGTLRSQRMSHSSDGSVKGKKLGRARSSILSISKNALQNCFHRPFQMAQMDALIHHQRLDLVEHGRMGGVAVHAIGAPRRDHADGRLLLQHHPHLHRRGVGAQHMDEPSACGAT